jgi:hypothetical protein
LGERYRRLFGADTDIEEAVVSLLGILWEARLGQPAVLAFLEQNWLEGGITAHTLAHFQKIVAVLFRHGLIDELACPTWQLRDMEDGDFFVGWHSQGTQA